MTPLTSGATARRMYGLVEPIGLIPYAADEPAEALLALGLRTYWDTYFAGRAAPLGRDVPAGVVHAIFYNFAPGEAARHIPRVWDLITPEAALAARDRGCVAALRRMLGDLAGYPSVARAADLAVKAATCTRTEGARGVRPPDVADGVVDLRDALAQRDNNPAFQASNAFGRGNTAIMQDDGNLVLYDQNNQPVWASNTDGFRGADLTVQDAGNMVVYLKGNALWASNTGAWPPPARIVPSAPPLTPASAPPAGWLTARWVRRTDGFRRWEAAGLS